MNLVENIVFQKQISANSLILQIHKNLMIRFAEKFALKFVVRTPQRIGKNAVV